MKVASALMLLTSLASMVNAHTYLSHVTLDGTKYAEGQCIRPYPANRNFPVKDPSSTDLTCGVGGLASTATKTCPVAAGSTITVEWHHDNDSSSDDIIAESHYGPCLVYMAPLSSNGKGDVWFKVFEDGYDAGSKKWCVDKIRANGGKLNIKLPADIKAGNYLLRTEIIALHESDTDYAVNPARGSQYYPNCAQVSVTGGGSAVPKGYAIPGIYKTNSPGILFNLYSSYSSYPIPGPPLYTGGAGSSPSSTPSVAAPTASAVQTSGRPKPTVTSSAPSVPKPTQPSSDKYITITKTKTKTKTKTNTKAIYATKTVHNCNA